MFLNVSFSNKINNLGKLLNCCQSTCRQEIKYTQAYIQRISDISPDNGVHCLSCGLKEINKNKELALEHLKALEANIKIATNAIKKDFISIGMSDVPKAGDPVYVYSTDTINGGLTKIFDVEIGISAGQKAIFVRLEVSPSSQFNWSFLKERQEELKNHYKNSLASPDHYRR